MAVATAKTPQVIAPTGIVPTAFTPAQVEGHYFPNNGATFLLVSGNFATYPSLYKRLSFDPMTVTLTAAGATKQFSSAAMTWDAGNDDLPGAAY